MTEKETEVNLREYMNDFRESVHSFVKEFLENGPADTESLAKTHILATVCVGSFAESLKKFSTTYEE